jgi:UDP-galactopyranose mutase
MTLDLVVVGAGLSGAVIAERAARELGWRVVVVERRGHIAGNTHDYTDEHGVLVHRYGPHVFHTNSERVWRYLAQFTTWRTYRHRVCAAIDGRLVPVPFNLNSLAILFPGARASSIRDALVQEYGLGVSVPILRLRQSPSYLVRVLADVVYEVLYLGYTVKQWGLRPEDLDPSVTGRVPVRIGYDDRYFTDRFQGIPRDGYTAMVRRMLAHPGIEVLLDADYHDVVRDLHYRHLVYTGPIDRFFEWRYGELPYRSVRFALLHSSRDRVQRTGAITHPRQHEYTRTCEYKVLTGQRIAGTTVSFEYPLPHVLDRTAPYYPIPAPQTRARYEAYARDAARLRDVTFCGRLASYQYLNMDQAVAQALKTCARLGARALGANEPAPIESRAADHGLC